MYRGNSAIWFAIPRFLVRDTPLNPVRDTPCSSTALAALPAFLSRFVIPRLLGFPRGDSWGRWHS